MRKYGMYFCNTQTSLALRSVFTIFANSKNPACEPDAKIDKYFQSYYEI